MIARPSPVPSIVISSSTPSLSNLLNNLSILSSFIPIPVSSTLNINLIASPFIMLLMVNVILPSSVYFAAFVSRFSITCFTLPLSPYKYSGIDSSFFTINSIGLSPILDFVNAASSSIILLKLYGVLIISSLSASIFDISNIPFTISNRLSLAISMSLTSSFISLGTFSLDSVSLNPTIAFNGVLISCDMLDKKSVFALLAFSARSFAKFNSLINFTSGFSIVKYIITHTNVSSAVKTKIPGYNFCIITHIILKIINTKNGQYFLSLKFFLSLIKQ